MNVLNSEDVMKALECCSVYENCDGCPHFDGVPEDDCHYKVMANALALLREKDAEIERLKADLHTWKDIAHRETGYVEKARADAITEFAKSVKMYFETYPEDEEAHALYVRNLVDQIAKEMKEGNG